MKTVSKAIAGAIATALVAWLARHDVLVDAPSVEAVVQFFIAAVIGFVTVYIAPRNQP